MLTIKMMLNTASQQLKPFSDTASLDAQLIMSVCTNMTRTEIFTYPEKVLSKTQRQQYHILLSRRLKGEPIAYILGYKAFWNLNLMVTPDVLIPRPETEHLIEWILKNHGNKKNCRIADLGTGSGAIALAIAKAQPTWQIDATDQSPSALNIAKQNARLYQIHNVAFYQGNWCTALPQKKYHIIVSNPPYISNNDPHLTDLQFEPQSALQAGESGLDAITKIISQTPAMLYPSGFLVLEHGYDQKDAVKTLLQKADFKQIQNFNDLAGVSRFTVAAYG